MWLRDAFVRQVRVLPNSVRDRRFRPYQCVAINHAWARDTRLAGQKRLSSGLIDVRSGAPPVLKCGHQRECHDNEREPKATGPESDTLAGLLTVNPAI